MRGVQGYLSSLQQRVDDSVKTEKEGVMLTLRDAAATDPFIHKLNMSCHSYSTPTLILNMSVILNNKEG